jgi:hypothetical protein
VVSILRLDASTWFLVVVGFLAYVFIGVSYATMGPQAFFQVLAHVATFTSLIAIVGLFL